MEIRFHVDRATGELHIHSHNVSEVEVEEVLGKPLEDRPGRDGSRVSVGQTRDGRYLRVIYVPDSTPGSIFVITAYDLGPKARLALRRRLRKKR